MKRLLLVCALLLSFVGAMFAVPPGEYYDSRGNFRALVHQSGRYIYTYERDGMTVKYEYEVIEEVKQEEGTYFQTKNNTLERKYGTALYPQGNGWFVDEKGRIAMNLNALPETVYLKR